MQPVARKGYQFFVTGKHRSDLFRKKVYHKESESRDACRRDDRFFQYLRHSLEKQGAEVIAGNRLHTLIQSHHNHDKQIGDTVDNAVSSYR